MLPVMAVVSLQSLELDTSVVYAITLTTVKSAKRDSTMNILSSKFKDQVMLQNLLSLLSMMISQLNKKFHKHNKKKNTIIIVMDMVTVMVTDTVMVTATVMVMVTDTVIVMNTVMNTVITITEVEEVDGDNT